MHLVVPVALLAMPVSGCGEGSRGVALLPPAPSERMAISESQPENPFVQMEGGPLARSSFAAIVSGYAIEVRDFLVGPAQKAVSVNVNGATVFEVRDGMGAVTIGDKTAGGVHGGHVHRIGGRKAAHRGERRSAHPARSYVQGCAMNRRGAVKLLAFGGAGRCAARMLVRLARVPA